MIHSPTKHDRQWERPELRVWYTNATSIGNKWPELRARTEKEDVIVVTESWLRPGELVDNLCPPNYISSRTDREDGRAGGGVLVLVAEHHVQYEARRLSTPNVQTVEVIVQNRRTPLSITGIYRSPSATSEENDQLLQLMDDTIGSNERVLLLGDLNAPEIDWVTETAPQGSFGHKLLQLMHRRTITQHVDEKTRWRFGQTASTLDLVFSKFPNEIGGFDVEEPIGKSDHGVLRLKFNFQGLVARDKFRRQWSKVDAVDLLSRASGMIWMVETEAHQVSVQWDRIKANLLQLTDQVAPEKRVRRRGNPPWWRARVKRAMLRKKRAWQRYKNNGGYRSHLQFKVARRQATRIQKECRQRYEDRLAGKAKENPKAYFNYVQSKGSLRKEVGAILDDEGTSQITSQGKAEALFRFFQRAYRPGRQDQAAIELPSCASHMPEVEITIADVHRALCDLVATKAAGPDGIHPSILKPLAEQLAEPLARLFNESLAQGQLPNDWLLATVIPIHKGGDRRACSNYRPVSLTSVVLKMMEKILRDKITTHLVANGLMSADQHGFRRRRSCLSNLLCFLDEVTRRIDRGEEVEVCYLDFQKAFDSVNHRLLSAKLEAFGLPPGLLTWINRCLMDRRFVVRVDNSESDQGQVLSGVPQGSVLGPLLFLLYINDLSTDLENPCYKFADDVKMVGTATSESMQRDLDRIYEWSVKWDLPLNASKCHRLVQGESATEDRMLGPTGQRVPIPTGAAVRDLGVTVTADFKSGLQCREAAKKASRALFQLKRAVGSRRPGTILPLYKAYVRPHLEYCVQAWSPNLVQDIKTLESVQRRFTKWFAGLRSLPYERRLEALNLFSLNRRRRRGDLIEAFKILKGFMEVPEGSLLKLSNTTTLRGHGLKLSKERVRTRMRASFFTTRVVNDWNKLPQEVITATTTDDFKRKLDMVWAGLFGEGN